MFRARHFRKARGGTGRGNGEVGRRGAGEYFMFENRKLLRETEWTRVYDVGSNQLFYESKFLVDGLKVSPADIKSRWKALSEQEQMDFVRAFQSKEPITPDDEEVLGFLMQVGNESVWNAI